MRTFGFHLYGLDMRQNSETHEATIAELFAWAGVCDDYAALDEDARVELLTAELANNRPLAGPNATFSETTTKELAITAAAAHAVRTFGEKAVPNHVISMCTSVSDMLETAVLLKEAGLLLDKGLRVNLTLATLERFGGFRIDTRAEDAALDRATAEARRLDVEHSRLEVEKRAEATSLRVEKLAKDKLAMRTVTPAITEYVTSSVALPVARRTPTPTSSVTLAVRPRRLNSSAERPSS